MQGNASQGGGSTVRNKYYRRRLFNKSILELNLAIYKTYAVHMYMYAAGLGTFTSAPALSLRSNDVLSMPL